MIDAFTTVVLVANCSVVMLVGNLGYTSDRKTKQLQNAHVEGLDDPLEMSHRAVEPTTVFTCNL